MKKLRLESFSRKLGMLLAAVSALPYAADVRGQDFQQQPLPSFYAGRPAGMSPVELQTASVPPVMLAQDGGPRQRGPREAAQPDGEPAQNARSAGPQRRPPSNAEAATKTEAAGPENSASESTEPTSRVYDGLPAEGREHVKPREPQSPSHQYPQPPSRQYPQPPSGTSPQRPHQGSLSSVERMMHAGAMQQFLELIKENCELKAQLKIQQIEFEAKQRLLVAEHAAEQQRRESEDRIGELESMNAELQQAQQLLAARAEKQMQELRSQMMEQSREMQRAQQGKTELEHRARALEAQLEHMKSNQKAPVQRERGVGDEPEQKRDSAREAGRKPRKQSERAKMPDGERSKEHENEGSGDSR